MKSIHYIVLALVFLLSCSMDEEKGVNSGREIEFRVVTTRGSVVDMNNFRSFTVVAFKADGTHFYTDEYEWNEVSFVSSEKHMWPTDGSTLYFQAYHQFGTEPSGETDTSEGSLLLEDFSPARTVSSQVDFICATASGNKNLAEPVALNFRHALSQIEVKGFNSNHRYICSVAGIRIAHVLSKGTYDFVNEEWNLGESKGVYEVIYTSPITLTDTPVSLMTQTDDNAFLIPQTLEPWLLDDETNELKGAYVALLVRITTIDGAIIYPLVDNPDVISGYDWAALPLDGKWEQGVKYTYKWNIPTVGGFVYPEKPTPEISMIDNFVSGSSIMGDQVTFLKPTLGDFNHNVVDRLYL